jgi:hypothetical protein
MVTYIYMYIGFWGVKETIFESGDWVCVASNAV